MKGGYSERWLLFDAVCDETQNLSETESETFFRYQFFSIPNPILFSIPNFFRYRYRYFFRYQFFSDTNTDTFFNTKIFPIPIPILFSIPNFFETDTDTFFDTKIFRNRYHQKNWKSFETEKFRNQHVTLCFNIWNL